MATHHQTPRQIRTVKYEPDRALRTISIAEQIAEDLAGDILSKRFKVGDRLGEESIAERFGVSRGPVRSALRILERKGLAENFPRRGVFVSELSVDRLRDVMEVRFWLLSLGARLCADRVTPDALEALAEQRDALAANLDPDDMPSPIYASMISSLFRTLVIHSGNARLPELVDQTLESSAWDVVWQNIEVDFQTIERRTEIFVPLKALCDAVERGDGAAAEKAARAYLDDSMRAALDAWHEAVAAQAR